jgi:hypothetical protein
MGQDSAPRLAAAWLNPLPLPGDIGGRPLLTAGSTPLILEQHRPKRILVLFDVGDPELGARPELPAMLELLLDRLAGRDLLLPVESAARDAADARIAPGPLPRATAATRVTSRRLDLAPWLLGAALILLLIDAGRGTRADRT